MIRLPTHKWPGLLGIGGVLVTKALGVGSPLVSNAAIVGAISSVGGFAMNKYSERQNKIESHKALRYLKVLKEYVKACRDTQRKDLLSSFGLEDDQNIFNKEDRDRTTNENHP